MAKIFICYRRSDSAGHAGRLYDRLVARFGRNRVYMDLDSIPFGSDFVEEITKALNGCAAVLVLIGPQWFAGENRPRLTAAGDHVRQEIAQALKSKAKVFPVLFQGARMPAGTELPKDIQALSRLHAIDLRDVSFDTDVQQLFKALERLDGLKPAKPAGTGSTRSKKTKSRTQTRSGGSADGASSRRTRKVLPPPPAVVPAPGANEPGKADTAGSGTRTRRGSTAEKSKQTKASESKAVAKQPAKIKRAGEGSTATKSAQASQKKGGRKSAGASGGTGGGGARAPKGGGSKSSGGGARKTAARRRPRGGRTR